MRRQPLDARPRLRHPDGARTRRRAPGRRAVRVMQGGAETDTGADEGSARRGLVMAQIVVGILFAGAAGLFWKVDSAQLGHTPETTYIVGWICAAVANIMIWTAKP